MVAASLDDSRRLALDRDDATGTDTDDACSRVGETSALSEPAPLDGVGQLRSEARIKIATGSRTSATPAAGTQQPAGYGPSSSNASSAKHGTRPPQRDRPHKQGLYGFRGLTSQRWNRCHGSGVASQREGTCQLGSHSFPGVLLSVWDIDLERLAGSAVQTAAHGWLGHFRDGRGLHRGRSAQTGWVV